MIPPYERCPKFVDTFSSNPNEHVVIEHDVRYDGQWFTGWCKFCGEYVYAAGHDDYWHPNRMHIIPEEVELADFLPHSSL